MNDMLQLLRDGAIATLKLNRPARRNAMTRAMWLALPALLAEVAADDTIALLQLEGSGGHFCGGADIGEFEQAYATQAAAAASNAGGRDAVEALAAFPKPSVAVIRGACVGGGVALALACDLRFAADDARFAVTPVRLGLIYSHADTQRLVRAIGAGRAKEMLFSARLIDAAEALRIGLVECLWPADCFDAAVSDYVAKLAMTSRPALRAVKAMVGAIADGATRETPTLRALFEDRFCGADFAEGSRAFLKKRAPHFTDR